MKKLAGFADEAADTIDDQIAVLKQIGWDAIELRTVAGFAAHDLPEKQFTHLERALDEAEVSVPCLGSTIANWSTPITAPFSETKEVVKRTIKRMKRLNCPMLRIMSYKVIEDSDGRIAADQQVDERIKRLRWICDALADEGMVAVHENCHTYGGLSWEHTQFVLEEVPLMKLVLDTGNPALTFDGRAEFPYPRQSAWEFYENTKEHIVHVHIKDAYYDEVTKTGYYTFPGEGDGDVKRIVADLQKRGYDGYYSIEPHMEVVFHDASAISTEERRVENFIEYARRFETLLNEL